MQARLGDRVLAYVRDGVPGLPMAAQEDMLRQTGISWEHVIRDMLTATQLRRREPGSLRQRAALLYPVMSLQPGATPDVICVAGLRCLGWNMADIARALAAAARRGTSIYAADTGKTFLPAALDADLLEALADTDETWRRGQTEDGRTAAASAITAKAEEARRAKLEVARPLWAKPPGEISGAEIAKAIGVSLRSLNKWLGPRSQARAKAKRF